MYKIFLLAFIVHVNAGHGGYFENTTPPGNCLPGNMVLNDCNWCKCKKGHYVCQNSDCSKADKFKHFNEAIIDINNIGMEGHGSWRSREPECEADTSYIRGQTMCICSPIGTWPNPACRTVFKNLRQTNLVANYVEPDNMICNPGEIYAFGCYVCHCPANGRIDTAYCADKLCPQVNVRYELTNFLRSKDVDVFAQCQPNTKYVVGIQECRCVDDNTLVCRNNNLKSRDLIRVDMSCEGRHGFINDGCNKCYCDENGYKFCTNHVCKETEQQPNYVQSYLISEL